MGNGGEPLQSGAMRVKLYNRQQAHTAMIAVWEKAKEGLQAERKLVLTLTEETRSTEQNAKMWATLGEIANQVNWYGQKLTAEEWKWVLSASLKKQRAVQGIDGGFVVLGQSTSKMTVAEMSEMIELAVAFGAQQGVIFKE